MAWVPNENDYGQPPLTGCNMYSYAAVGGVFGIQNQAGYTQNLDVQLRSHRYQTSYPAGINYERHVTVNRHRLKGRDKRPNYGDGVLIKNDFRITSHNRSYVIKDTLSQTEWLSVITEDLPDIEESDSE